MAVALVDSKLTSIEYELNRYFADEFELASDTAIALEASVAPPPERLDVSPERAREEHARAQAAVVAEQSAQIQNAIRELLRNYGELIPRDLARIMHAQGFNIMR